MPAARVAYDLLDPLIAPIAWQPVEFCIMLYLGEGARLVGLRHIRGGRSGIEVSARQLVADALAFDARAAIMAHNHPSGDATASRADLSVTSRLARALDAVEVTLVDHVVLAGAARTSLREAGYL